MSSFSIINPHTGNVLDKIEYTTQEQVESVVKKANEAKAWQRNLTRRDRCDILLKLRTLLRDNSEEMAKLITSEMGKSISEARVEMKRAISTVEHSAVEALKAEGEVIESDVFNPKDERYAIITRFPIGVVLAITPFNFPINLALHKIGPAFAGGNTIIFKPSPQCYLSSKRLYELCVEAGMKEDSIQLILPDVAQMQWLCESENINCVSFTGGTATARAIAKSSGIKKLLFELGGNDPLILMPDGDLDKAVETTINQRFGTSGQRCTASKRLFIHSDCYEEFKTKLLDKTNKLVCGDPLDESTYVGPVVSVDSAKVIEARIKDAISLGAKLLAGGNRKEAFVEPTILEDVPIHAELVADETFGPVIPLFKFSDIEEIIPIINGTPYGLQAGIFTKDIKLIKKLYKKLEVGALIAGDGPGFRMEHIPFGGVKLSGLGREGVKYAMEEMTFIKTLVL